MAARLSPPGVGRLAGIAVRPERRAAVRELREAEVVAGRGLAGDHYHRGGRRQLTVLTREGWEAACAQVGGALPWTARRANLLIEGLELDRRVGHRLCIGEVALEITGQTSPCRRMEEVFPGLLRALSPHWRGGVTCRVLRGGRLVVGAAVALDDPRALGLAPGPPPLP